MNQRETATHDVATLDKATQERLKSILMQDANALTEEDMAFLKARRDYLSAAERKDFGLDTKPAKEESEKKEIPNEGGEVKKGKAK